MNANALAIVGAGLRARPASLATHTSRRGTVGDSRIAPDLPWQGHGILSRVGGSTDMTSEDREDIKRLFGVVTEDLLSKVQQVAEGVAAGHQAAERFHTEFDTFRAEAGRNFADVGRQFAAIRSEASAFREETARNFAAVRSEADAFRVETSREFAAVRSEAEAFRDETARNFAVVRSEAEAFRDETGRHFAAVRSEIAGSRTSTALPRRPRTRRRPN